jgi:ribose transport system permease protein
MTEDNQAPPTKPARTGDSMLGKAMKLLGPFIGLFVVLILFSIPSDVRPTFLSLANFQVVANQTVIVALGALGMTLIIISGGIDLSVGSVVALSGVLTATWLSTLHVSPVVAVIGGILIGGLVGVCNGATIVGLRVTPFIVTLGTLGIARGVAKCIAHENAVYVTQHTWIDRLTENTSLGGLSQAVWISIALAIVVNIVLRYTVFGRSVYAIGSNETASRLSGLRVDALKIAIYGIAGLFFGLSGVIQFSRLGAVGDPTIAAGEELDVIAAVVIGGASLSGGEGSILGSMIGALIMTLLRNGAQLMGWPSYTQEIIIGSVIVIAVALDRIRHRRQGGSL